MGVGLVVSTPDALHTLLLPRLEGIRKVNTGYQTRCPAHEDNNPSLSISVGKKQPILLQCHAGCTSDAILKELNLSWEDISAPRDTAAGDRRDDVWTPAGPASDVYDYHDEKGTLLYQVLRVPQPAGKKTFRQRVPDPLAASGWRWRLDDTRRVPYRLPQLLQATEAGETVWIVEGEKDVQTLVRHGVTATCNPQGAGKWQPEFSGFLVDAHVKIVADKDKPGQAHARAIAENLEGVSASVTIVEAAEGKDVTEHLNAGKTLDQLLTTWATETDQPADLAPDLHVFLSEPDPPQRWVIPDLMERGDRLIWTGFEGLGKATATNTPVPTPKGWTTMGALSVGDEVFAPDGSTTRIVAATGIMRDRPCYRLRFSDGAEIVADANHLWLTETVRAREAAARYAKKPTTVRKHGTNQQAKRLHFPSVVSTVDIAASLRARDGHVINHSIVTAAPLHYPQQEQSIPAYVLGVWLGDGTSTFPTLTCADDGILEELRREGEPVRKLLHSGPYAYTWAGPRGGPNGDESRMSVRLRLLGLIGNKHIPANYLRGAVEQRLALLQGLMDTDGTIGAEGRAEGRGSGAALCEFSVCSERLARDFLELVLGLGIKATWHQGPATLEGRIVGTRYRITFQTDLQVFRLQRKRDRHTPLRTRRAALRYVTAVDPIDSVPVRCVQVDREDGMFVVGRECIPTHNSVIVRTLAIAAAAGVHPFRNESFTPQRVLYIDCENSERQGRKRFRTIERVARMKNHRVPDDTMFVIHRPAGIDLSREPDASWLLERVRAHMPDLLICGPFYRLHDSDSEEERSARKVVKVLDEARVLADCALIIEHHSPHGQSGGARAVRPFGSSLLLRWPELGMGIVPDSDEWPCRNVKVVPFRGNRDERDWPRKLRWSVVDGEWPWVVDTTVQKPTT